MLHLLHLRKQPTTFISWEEYSLSMESTAINSWRETTRKQSQKNTLTAHN